MTKHTALSLVLLAFLACFCETASAQITIKIPDVPRIKKSKPESPKPQPATTSDDQTSHPAAGETPVSRPAAQVSDKWADSAWVSVHLEDIAKTQTEIDEYDPAERDYLVSHTQDNYLLLAISPRAREHWLKSANAFEIRQSPNNKLDPALDALAASAAKKLSAYHPNASSFRFRDPVAEKLLMGYFKNAATIKVHRIGVDTAGWQIQKDDDGLPSYRYKNASAYLRDTNDDHPYCRVVSVRVKQDYAGGGTYSSETYRSSASEDLFGCPASGR